MKQSIFIHHSIKNCSGLPEQLVLTSFESPAGDYRGWSVSYFLKSLQPDSFVMVTPHPMGVIDAFSTRTGLLQPSFHRLQKQNSSIYTSVYSPNFCQSA